MANPRTTPAFDRIDAREVTLIADGVTILFSDTALGGSASVGLAVNLSASRTVQLVSDAQPVYGRLTKVEKDLKCSVQRGGVMEFPGGDAATLTPGSKIVGAVGPAAVKGRVRSVAAATLAEVAVARGVILDATDPTKVFVDFDA